MNANQLHYSNIFQSLLISSSIFKFLQNTILSLLSSNLLIKKSYFSFILTLLYNLTLSLLLYLINSKYYQIEIMSEQQQKFFSYSFLKELLNDQNVFTIHNIYIIMIYANNFYQHRQQIRVEINGIAYNKEYIQIYQFMRMFFALYILLIFI